MDSNPSTLIGYKIALLAKTKRELVDRDMKALGLSRTQWQTLVRFSIFGTPCSQKTLQNLMEIDGAHLTRTLDQLTEKGLITRTSDTKDRRSTNINLTRTGQSLLPKINAIMVHESEVLLSGFAEQEKAMLDQLLTKLTHNALTALKS